MSFLVSEHVNLESYIKENAQKVSKVLPTILATGI